MIEMVHTLAAQKRPPDLSFHNNNMFVNITIRMGSWMFGKVDQGVAIGVNSPATLPARAKFTPATIFIAFPNGFCRGFDAFRFKRSGHLLPDFLGSLAPSKAWHTHLLPSLRPLAAAHLVPRDKAKGLAFYVALFGKMITANWRWLATTTFAEFNTRIRGCFHCRHDNRSCELWGVLTI